MNRRLWPVMACKTGDPPGSSIPKEIRPFLCKRGVGIELLFVDEISKIKVYIIYLIRRFMQRYIYPVESDCTTFASIC